MTKAPLDRVLWLVQRIAKVIYAIMTCDSANSLKAYHWISYDSVASKFVVEESCDGDWELLGGGTTL